MKLSDFLQLIGIEPDDDKEKTVDNEKKQDDKKEDASSQALDKKEISINIVNDTKEDKKDASVNDAKEQEEHKVDLSKIKFENGKFTGLKTLGEEDGDLKALLESVNTYTDRQTAHKAIYSAIETELDKYEITEGISKDIIVNSIINNVGVGYDNDKVHGVEEAFANLAKNNTGMLKAKTADDDNKDNGKKDNNSGSSKESAEGPALEGFSKNMNDANPLCDTDLVNFAFGNE